MGQALRRVEPGTGGITRQRAGRGFRFVAANGQRITSPERLASFRALAIPPAWEQVWIAGDPWAHIQATGVDAAGRVQYQYHPLWREQRDAEKFTRSLAFAARLPSLRRALTRDLKQQHDARRRALAAAVRLMDAAGLRVGGAVYAQDHGSFGASTLQRRHVELDGAGIHLLFRGKSAGRWDVTLRDPLLSSFLHGIPRTPRRAPAVCYGIAEGRRTSWQGISDGEVNDYLSRVAGPDFTAKDFRTWQGTQVAAVSLARSARSGLAPADAPAAAVNDAARWLHNTPTVARESYINPRVFELFEAGRVASLARQPDAAVLALLQNRS